MPFFPGGVVGVGLLLLRLSLVASLLAMSGGVQPGWKPYAIAALAAGLVAGFQARTFALLLAAITSLQLVRHELAPAPALILLLDALALCAIGPGAFSVDARLFGHRTVVVRDRNQT